MTGVARVLALGLSSVLGAALLSACIATVQPPSSSPSRPPSSQTSLSALPAEHGLDLVEHWVGGAQPGDDVPTLVVVHGLGDTPENLYRGFEGAISVPARVVLPRGPTPWGRGSAWMTIRTREGRDEALAAQVDASAARVAALCRDLGESGRKPVLTGFSQGGMIAWTVAARYPETIRGALPLSGYLPQLLVPASGPMPAPILAFHGDSDEIVPLSLAEAGRAALDRPGVSLQLVTFEGPHVIPPQVRTAVVRQALAWSETGSAAGQRE